MRDYECLWFVFCPPASTGLVTRVLDTPGECQCQEVLGVGGVCCQRWHCNHLRLLQGTLSWWHCTPQCHPCQGIARHHSKPSQTRVFLPWAWLCCSGVWNQRSENIYCKLNAINMPKSDRPAIEKLFEKAVKKQSILSQELFWPFQYLYWPIKINVKYFHRLTKYYLTCRNLPASLDPSGFMFATLCSNALRRNFPWIMTTS